MSHSIPSLNKNLAGIALFILNLVVFVLEGCYAMTRWREEESIRMWRRVVSISEANTILKVMTGSATEAGDDAARVTQVLRQSLVAEEDVVIDHKVGQGAFGNVFKGFYLSEPVSVITLEDMDEPSLRTFRAHIVATADLRHPCIVNLKGACWGMELGAVLLTEWAGQQTLADALADKDLTVSEPFGTPP